MTNFDFNFNGAVKTVSNGKKAAKFMYPVLALASTVNTIRLYSKATELLQVEHEGKVKIININGTMMVTKSNDLGFKLANSSKTAGIGCILSGSDANAYAELGGKVQNYRLATTPIIIQGSPAYVLVKEDEYTEEIEAAIAQAAANMNGDAEAVAEPVVENVTEEEDEF